MGKSSSILPLLKKTKSERAKESETGSLSSGSNQFHLIKTWLKFFGWIPAAIYLSHHTLLRHTVSPCLSLWLVTAVARSPGYTLLIGCHGERSCSNMGCNLKSHCWTPEDARFVCLLFVMLGWVRGDNRQTMQVEDLERRSCSGKPPKHWKSRKHDKPNTLSGLCGGQTQTDGPNFFPSGDELIDILNAQSIKLIKYNYIK